MAAASYHALSESSPDDLVGVSALAGVVGPEEVKNAPVEGCVGGRAVHNWLRTDNGRCGQAAGEAALEEVGAHKVGGGVGPACAAGLRGAEHTALLEARAHL